MSSHLVLTGLDLLIDLAIFSALAISIISGKIPPRWRWTVVAMAAVVLFNLTQSVLATDEAPSTLFSVDRIVHAGEVIAFVGMMAVFRTEMVRPSNLVTRAEKRHPAHGPRIDDVRAIVIMSTPDGVVRDINRHGRELLGTRACKLIGNEVFSLAVCPGELRRAREDFMRFVASAGRLGGESEYAISAGAKTRLINWRRTAQIDSTGSVIGVVSYGDDVTERRDAEEHLADKSHLLDSVHDAVIVTSVAGERLYFNRAAHEMLGMTHEDFERLAPFEWLSISDLVGTDHDIAEMIWSDGQVIEVKARHRNGTEVPLELRSQRIQFARKDCVMTVIRDISARQQAENLMTQLAYTDALTGLANRRMVLDQLTEGIVSVAKYGTSLAVLYVDVDNLKGVNDRLGHATGDELIVLVGKRLVGVVREQDLVGRVGGDEFILVIDDAGSRESVESVACRLLESLGEPLMLRGHELRISASIGVALAKGTESAEELVTKADRAMYFAKRAGGDRYLIHDASMDESYLDEFALKNDLSQALDRKEFFLEYQPIVDSALQKITAVEALVRWAHPTRGVLPPDAFIGLAEQTGAIREIGRWVLHSACRSLTEFRRKGLALERIAVNVSPLQLTDPSFLSDVMVTLRFYGIQPESLELELIETQAMDHSSDIESVFGELREAGVRIALDDFGVGHSSLERLRRLPITTLKLDQTFVKDLCNTSTAHPIVETILVLAENLDLRVVAEGVETTCQADHLRNAGCDELQGYAFSRPCSLPSLLEWSKAPISPRECNHPCPRGVEMAHAEMAGAMRAVVEGVRV